MPEAKPVMRKVQQRENASSPSTSTSAPASPQIAGVETQIRLRAYEIWQKSGQPDGRALEHWLQAEAEIRDASSKAA